MDYWTSLSSPIRRRCRVWRVPNSSDRTVRGPRGEPCATQRWGVRSSRDAAFPNGWPMAVRVVGEGPRNSKIMGRYRSWGN